MCRRDHRRLTVFAVRPISLYVGYRTVGAAGSCSNDMPAAVMRSRAPRAPIKPCLDAVHGSLVMDADETEIAIQPDDPARLRRDRGAAVDRRCGRFTKLNRLVSSRRKTMT